MDKASFCEAMNNQLVALVRRAGKAILTIYDSESPIQIDTKADASPVTAADLAAHHILLTGLKTIFDIPILSEEGELPNVLERSYWSRYWLIDPLDGTKEFIQRNGEFTVNVALIEKGLAVLGVVHVAVSDVTYLGVNKSNLLEKKALKYSQEGAPQIIHGRSLQLIYGQRQALRVLASHRQGSDNVSELLVKMRMRWPGDMIKTCVGSSLKFCLLAEGKADFYPRLAPTSEWDTAAGQAVLEAAGGVVLDATAIAQQVGVPLRYNTKASMLNPSFYALGDAQFDWSILLSN